MLVGLENKISAKNCYIELLFVVGVILYVVLKLLDDM
jgi:hypothetical protein